LFESQISQISLISTEATPASMATWFTYTVSLNEFKHLPANIFLLWSWN